MKDTGFDRVQWGEVKTHREREREKVEGGDEERERERGCARACQKEPTDKGSGKDRVGPSARKAKGTKDGEEGRRDGRIVDRLRRRYTGSYRIVQERVENASDLSPRKGPSRATRSIFVATRAARPE